MGPSIGGTNARSEAMLTLAPDADPVVRESSIAARIRPEYRGVCRHDCNELLRQSLQGPPESYLALLRERGRQGG